MQPKLGRPLNPPTIEEIDKIAEHCRQNMALSIAGMSVGIHPYKLDKWMRIGSDDLKEGNYTIHAQLFKRVRESQALKANELLEKIEKCPKNWQALAWKLQNCLKEHFGQESEEHKELLEIVKRLCEDVAKIKETKGINNGAL